MVEVLAFGVRDDYLFATVKPALGTYPVQKYSVTAIAAFNQIGSDKFHVDRLPTPGSGFGRLEFRNSHI